MTGELAGLSLVGARRVAAGARTFRAQDPATGEWLDPEYHAASPSDVEDACRLAAQAFEIYRETSGSVRAGFLRTIALGLETAGEAIVARAGLETRLPKGRLQSELLRTSQQLRLFATLVEDGSWVDARIDTADPARRPVPRPDVRSMRIPLGPVGVFGASNFPLAFSVAGGDTASALAAGNTVIVKAHAAHPGTSELVARVIVDAIRHSALPEGVFALLFDDGVTVGEALVQHSLVQGVGFTGSRAGGDALVRLAAGRPRPIPVYAEMGSVNPVVVLPGALAERSGAIADGLHASFTLGVGQFCTNPGVVFVPKGSDGDAFAEHLVALTRSTPAGPMLTAKIASAYEAGLEQMRRLGAVPLAHGMPGTGRAALFKVGGTTALAEPGLLEEVFGPSTLLVSYSSVEELERMVLSLDGQLSASVHGLDEEIRAHAALLRLLSSRVGRLVFNQFPTGVEVVPAMVHGGPYPATSDGRSTSVGTRAIERFSRFVAFQGAPQEGLPPELHDANPHGLSRLVNGVRSSTPLAVPR
jgi:alpha-ketoglutaric semialdehyde dehydrogenase